MSLETNGRPSVIGLYGISGSGKSHLLKALEMEMGTDMFVYFEGSEVLAKLVPGGLGAFKKLVNDEKARYREDAIQHVQLVCHTEKKIGLLAGHYMFPSFVIEDDEPTCVGTRRDFDVFTHMIYLDIHPSTIAALRSSDDPQKRQERGTLSIDQLSNWQAKERSTLRVDCYHERVFFTTISEDSADGPAVSKLILSMLEYDQERNRVRVLAEVDQALKYNTKALVVLDADKTLAEADSGRLYCQEAYAGNFDALKAIFDRYSYVHEAFRQVALLYTEVGSAKFKRICSDVASDITLYREIEGYLKACNDEKDVVTIIVSCGPRLVWQEVLRRKGFSKFTVIGLGQADSTIVDPDIKKAIVKHAQKRGIHVTALGDSPIDIPMLRAADKSLWLLVRRLLAVSLWTRC